jgi:hypothetical protein
VSSRQRIKPLKWYEGEAKTYERTHESARHRPHERSRRWRVCCCCVPTVMLLLPQIVSTKGSNLTPIGLSTRKHASLVTSKSLIQTNRHHAKFCKPAVCTTHVRCRKCAGLPTVKVTARAHDPSPLTYVYHQKFIKKNFVAQQD